MLKYELTREPGLAAAVFAIASSTPGDLGHVAVVGAEHEDEGIELPAAELLAGALVGLVALGARDRELLQPAVGDLPGREHTEAGQQHPADDDGNAVANDPVGEALHAPNLPIGAVARW